MSSLNNDDFVRYEAAHDPLFKNASKAKEP
jgi:hypothetical protein